MLKLIMKIWFTYDNSGCPTVSHIFTLRAKENKPFLTSESIQPIKIIKVCNYHTIIVNYKSTTNFILVAYGMIFMVIGWEPVMWCDSRLVIGQSGTKRNDCAERLLKQLDADVRV